MNSTQMVNAATKQGSMKERAQVFGRFLSGMVMPNIAAFIAWGFITALFIPTGWLPNETFSKLVGPIIINLLPLLIGYTGGRMVGGQRGAVVGSIATMGVIVGIDTPQFMAAMVVGPLAGLLTKKMDEALEGKIPAGFEMLVNNFSAGILAMALAMVNLIAIGPIFSGISTLLSTIIQGIVNAGVLPLVSLIIEPGKILFLNNAINHGVLSPIGIQQASEMGRSIIFMLESNPGPGLGILMAYALFSKGMVKQSAPGAVIIHFLGGIHEIYFPYVLMNPILVLAAIAGGMSGVFTFSLLGAGLVGPPSPGSIFAYILMTPRGGAFPVMFGVLVSAVVSFLVASVFIKRSKEFSGQNLTEAKSAVQDMKAAAKGLKKASISKIAVACDAGMGSSAMGASILRKKLKNAGLDIEVLHTSIEDIPSNTDIVITHTSLTARAKSAAPNAEHISIENFVETNVYDELVNRIKTK